MSLWVHLALRILGWVGLACLLLVGLAALAGTVEGVRYGAQAAVMLAALEALPVTVPLIPVACAVGAGAAAARLHALGEAVALQAVGVPPLKPALVACAVGLVAGLVGLGVHQQVVPEAAAQALALRVELGSAAADDGWLWTGESAVRVADGTQVHGAAGQVQVVAGLGPAPEALRRQARALRQPVVAGTAELEGGARPLRVEAAVRVARAVGCGLLALLAFLGPRERSTRRVGPALILGVAWQALAMVSASLAVGEQALGEGAAVWAGAWGPVALLGLLLAVRLRI